MYFPNCYLILLTIICLGRAAHSENVCSQARDIANGAGSSFVPDCDEKNADYYKTKQCDRVVGVCFCVEKETGLEIAGTRVNEEQSTVDCDAAQPSERNLDEDDACYQQNKIMIDQWNARMREYNEVHLERWKASMDKYEDAMDDNKPETTAALP